MGRMVECFLFFCRPSRLRRSGCTFAKCIFSNASSIFDHFGILDHLGPFQTIVDHFRLSWTILDHLGPYWIILNNIGPWHNFLAILDHSPGHWSNILEGRYIIGIRMQNRQMTICEEISAPPVCPTDVFATRMHASCLCPGV